MYLVFTTNWEHTQKKENLNYLQIRNNKKVKYVYCSIKHWVCKRYSLRIAKVTAAIVVVYE